MSAGDSRGCIGHSVRSAATPWRSAQTVVPMPGRHAIHNPVRRLARQGPESTTVRAGGCG